MGASEVNPLHTYDISLPRKLVKKQSYLPFAVFEVVKLRQAAQNGDTVLAQYIDIAQWTGMRLAEKAQLSARESIVTADDVECLKVKKDACKDEKGVSGSMVPVVNTLGARVPLQQPLTSP